MGDVLERACRCLRWVCTRLGVEILRACVLCSCALFKGNACACTRVAFPCVQFNGALPLHVAASRNAVNVVNLLVKLNIDQSAQDYVSGGAQLCAYALVYVCAYALVCVRMCVYVCVTDYLSGGA